MTVAAPARRTIRLLGTALLCAVSVASAAAQKFYTYVTDVGPDYVELSWGTCDGANTIGRSAPSHGMATVHIAGRTLSTRANSIVAGNLKPDQTYPYDVSIGNQQIGKASIRTWPAKSDHITFFVIGDFGTGNQVQRDVAGAMLQEYRKRASSDSPVRLILGLGDTIYGDVSSFLLGLGHTGKEDRDWGPKFFDPYERLIAEIPFFGILGNHDGNETESHRDMNQFLDNFAYPGGKPARYFRFSYGGLVDFFGLDSTSNTESGPARPFYLEDGQEFHWMQQAFAESQAPWKIPFFHHPLYSAGPLHPPNTSQLRHWANLFANTGVKVVFSGHEHNLQVSQANAATRGITWVVSGAGGELRHGNVEPNMKAANIAAWAAQNHFLVVEIAGKTMHITPVSFAPMDIRDAAGRVVQPPFVVNVP